MCDNTFQIYSTLGTFNISSTGKLQVNALLLLDLYSMTVGICDRGIPMNCASRDIVVRVMSGTLIRPILSDPSPTIAYNHWFINGFKLVQLHALLVIISTQILIV